MSLSLITFLVSFLISSVSAYCTISGYGSIFTSAATTCMIIAGVIELGRIVLMYDLHHYWKIMPRIKKILGTGILLVALSLSAIGIFGFLANAYSAKTQEVRPIQIEISQYQNEIDLLNKEITLNNEQISSIKTNMESKSMNKALDVYIEKEYVTKALNIQKGFQNEIKQLNATNTELNKKIISLDEKIFNLQKDIEIKSPSIAHLKYFAKLFHTDDDMTIVIFIVMIMICFDNLAMYLMTVSDWIKTINGEIKISFPAKSVKNDEIIPAKSVKNDEKIVEKCENKEVKVEEKKDEVIENKELSETEKLFDENKDGILDEKEKEKYSYFNSLMEKVKKNI